jgi:hypothetical protein
MAPRPFSFLAPVRFAVKTFPSVVRWREVCIASAVFWLTEQAWFCFPDLRAQILGHGGQKHNADAVL